MRISLKASRARNQRALAASRAFAELADIALAEGNLAEAARHIEDAFNAYDAAASASEAPALSSSLSLSLKTFNSVSTESLSLA